MTNDSFRHHITNWQFKAIIQATQHLRDGKPFEPNVYFLIEHNGEQVKINLLDIEVPK